MKRSMCISYPHVCLRFSCTLTALSFISDYIHLDMEDDDFWDMEFGGDAKQKKRVRRAPAPVREKAPSGGRRGIDRESIIAKYKIMQVRVQDRNGNFFMVKKKVR